MTIPRYKGIESIDYIISWFLKHDKTLKSKLWKNKEARIELNNKLTLLFQNRQQREIKESINVLFHEFTYISLPQLEEWEQKNILQPEEEEAYLNLLTLVLFQNAQLRIAGWIYQQLFKTEFTPFGNPFQILGYFDGFIDYYQVLGLPFTCTAEDIKKAYRTKAKTLHPDTGGDAEEFKQLKESYDVLSDDQKKRVYDEKYEFYQNQYKYDINPFPMESHNTVTSNSQRPRFAIRFQWKAFSIVFSSFLLLISVITILNESREPETTYETFQLEETTDPIQSTQPSETEQLSSFKKASEELSDIVELDTDSESESSPVGGEETNAFNQKLEYLQKLDNIEKGLAELDYLYKNGITSEMMEAESETYKRWDGALNEIYGVLQDQLTSDEFNQLREEQRQWVVYRDYTAKTESIEFKGGTMESLQYISTQARLTKERSYELVQNYIPE